jgi:quaternary ammonium compound-resistance protein SugE
MAWIYLLIAGAFEIGWAAGLKYTNGLTKFWPSVFTIIAMVLTYVFLALAAKTIPLGTAYAIWAGIGVVGAAIAGIVLFGEPKDTMKFVCIGLIVVGIAGLKYSTK